MRLVGRTREWLRYDVPDQWIRRELRGNYRGQKQIWFCCGWLRAIATFACARARIRSSMRGVGTITGSRLMR